MVVEKVQVKREMYISIMLDRWGGVVWGGLFLVTRLL
jgi:succinyl-CoA synthetase beta subunit